MTYKQRILSEIERKYNEWKLGNSAEAKYRCEAYKELIELIKPIQEEPASEFLDTESMIESYKQRLMSQVNGMKDSIYVKMCLASYKHGINETLDTLNLSNVEKTIKDSKEKPVSIWHSIEELPTAREYEYILVIYKDTTSPRVAGNKTQVLYWDRVDKWAYLNDVLNLSNIQRTVKNWKEPVSGDLEEASKSYGKEQYNKQLNLLPDKCRACYDPIVNAFKEGAKWQYEQFENNRLAACDRQTKEEDETEME